MQQAQTEQTQGRLQMPMPSPPLTALAGNRLLDRTSVPLHGTVTDASGAGVRNASVAVKSLATGDVVNTSTDAKGEFTAHGTPGSAYQISASAPGFRNATVNEVTPANGTPQPVNLQLNVGSTAETVEVTAAAVPIVEPRVDAASVSVSGAVAGARADTASFGVNGAVAEMKKAKVAQAPVPALPYHLFSRIAGGEPVEVPANGTVPAGATLVLRVTPAADGYFRIVPSTGRAIASPKVRRGLAFETTLPPFDQPGRVELQVYFSSRAGGSKDQALAPALTIAFNIQ
jgi:hypothetical protein